MIHGHPTHTSHRPYVCYDYVLCVDDVMTEKAENNPNLL